tara:strand:+ start:295 stop:642 length:348 start_codon:yes stop_codon:yes gene_type:complete
VCNPNTGECEDSTNCISNQDCPTGQVCNTVTGQCEETTGGGSSNGGTANWGEACGSLLGGGGGSTATCADGLVCGIASGICEELCDTPGACSDCCPISGGNYCEAGVLVNFCRVQ